MVIIETSVFTRRVVQMLSDEDYRALQNHLIERPDAGAIIKGSVGLRKVRWALHGRGKRGGARVIYYWATPRDQILMLFLFAKNEADDLSEAQLKVLREEVTRQFEI